MSQMVISAESSTPKQRRVVLAGGSGFLGRALAADFSARRWDVVILTRSADPAASESPRQVQWDGRTAGAWAREIDGAEVVINLTGKSVNCRHTPENIHEINRSRVDSVRVMDQVITRCAQPPKILVQAASAAIYGDPGQRICDESTPPGLSTDGSAVQTCLLWETAFDEGAVLTPATRRAILRIGFVLGPGGGALGTLGKLTRLGLGGRVGTGRQYISWIHIDDFVRMVGWIIEHDQSSGIYNATGPTPVTNGTFMRSLRRALHRPWSPPVPAWLVHIGAWLIGTQADLALSGRRVLPVRIAAEGFQFKFTDLDASLEQILARRGAAPRPAAV